LTGSIDRCQYLALATTSQPDGEDMIDEISTFRTADGLKHFGRSWRPDDRSPDAAVTILHGGAGIVGAACR